MSIRSLKTFLTVVRKGTFAAAAKELGITQAAVSQQIKTLETELKVKLFDRIGRAVLLNASGRALVEKATGIVDQYEGLSMSLNGEDLAGSLVVGGNRTSFERLLPLALTALKRRHPKIEVKVLSGVSTDLAVKVERGELDAALVANPPAALPRSLVLHHIADEVLVFVAPKSLKIERVRDTLVTAPFIRLSSLGWVGKHVDDLLRRKGINVSEVMEIDNSHVIANMVAHGFGVSIVSMFDGTWHNDPRLQIWRVKESQVNPGVNLIERRSHTRRTLTAALLDLLLKTARSSGPRNRLRVVSL